jgi:cell envelope opacity-associated protein A
VRHVGHGQHAAATVAIASAVMAPLPASSAAKADVPDSPATVEPPAAPHAEERLADTARAVAGRPAEPAAGEGQLADASVN